MCSISGLDGGMRSTECHSSFIFLLSTEANDAVIEKYHRLTFNDHEYVCKRGIKVSEITRHHCVHGTTWTLNVGCSCGKGEYFLFRTWYSIYTYFGGSDASASYSLSVPSDFFFIVCFCCKVL